MACLDTSCLLDLAGRSGRRVRTRAEVVVASQVQQGERLSTTRINVAELLVGVHLSTDPDDEGRRVDVLLDDLEIFEFDAVAARCFAAQTAALKRRGRPIGDLDVMIASIALVNGESLITRNATHFREIEGLTMLTY